MIYFEFFKMHLKKLGQYRLSLILMTVAQVISSLFSLLIVYILFDRFNIVAGWTFQQVALTFAVVMFGFSFSECFLRGMDQFSKLVKSGTLDRLFIRPRKIITQICCQDIEFSKIGRLMVSVAVLVYAMCVQSFVWTFPKVLVLIGMFSSAVIIFFGIFMLGAALSIFTVDGIEVINIFSDGGRELCQYPLNIYAKGITKFFTFVIPFATFNFLPLMWLNDMPGATVFGNALAPLYGCLFVVPCYFILRWALTKYTSTGT